MIVIDDTSQGQPRLRQRLMKTFIVQALLTIVTYDRKNMFIVQATELNDIGANDIGAEDNQGKIITKNGI